MKTLKVEEMHCMNCVNRISSALRAEAIEFEIELEEKIVRVEPENVERAIDLLDDLGFTASL